MSAESLVDRLTRIEAQIARLWSQIKPMQQEASRLDVERQHLVRQIEDAKREPKVSDHAVIRYLERVYGFSFDEVRAEILTPDRASAIRAGASRISHGGVSFLVRDRTITTVLGPHGAAE